MKLRIRPDRLFLGVLLLLMVGSLARSIEQARWTEGLQVLMPIAVLGVICGVLLAESRLGTVRAHAFGSLLGLVIVVWQTGQVLTPEELNGGARVGVVISRFREWLSVIISGGKSQDELLFVFTMGAIVWFLSYNSSWFVLRYGWAWWAVLPIGLVMLVNLGYSIRPNYTPFFVFLISAMLLMIGSHFMRNSSRWEQEGLGREPGIGTKVMLLGSIVSLLLVALAWQGPTRSFAITAKNALQSAAKPWERIQDRWQDAFAFLYPGAPNNSVQGIGGGFTSFTDKFQLGGPLRMGTRRVFTAEGEIGQYWKVVALDSYTGEGWDTSDSASDRAPNTAVRSNALPQRASLSKFKKGVEKVEQQVTVDLPLRSNIIAADSPVSVDRQTIWGLTPVERQVVIPVRGKLARLQPAERAAELQGLRSLLLRMGPQRVARASADGVDLRDLPPRVQPGAPPSEGSDQPAGTAVPTATVAPDPAEEYAEELLYKFQALREVGIEATYTYRRGKPAVISYSYVEPNQEDVLKATAAEPLRKGDTYSVSSIIANPNEEQLNAANGPAPAWVRDRYLLLPDTVTQRVRDLVATITRDDKTVHEKARSIESYLRSMKYREDMPQLPPGRDFVDHFLFDLQEGYCTYYASAMVVMLRSLDIPARFVTGFAPGKYNSKTGELEVTEAQAHAWPEVYFAGYGWVTYEPTPIRDPVERSAGESLDNSGGLNSTGRFNGDPSDDRPRTGRNPADGDGNSSTLTRPARYSLSLLGGLAGVFLFIFFFSLIRLRGLRGATRQYAKLLQVGTVIGVRPARSETPGEYGHRLSGEIPNAQGAVQRITSSYVAEVFGRRRAGPDELEGEWRRVATQAARSVPRRMTADVRERGIGKGVRRLLRRE